MKIMDKTNTRTFGEFVAGAYQAWGTRRAKGLLRLAFTARLVVFQRPPHLAILEK